jgi:glucan phosphorylase
MKAGLNGSLNFGMLDGFWAEGYEQGQNGWAVASDRSPDEGTQDARDAAAVYDLIEHEVVPAFYDRDDIAWCVLAPTRRGVLRDVIANFRPAANPHTEADLVVVLQPSTRSTHDNERPPPSPHLRI